MQACSDWVCFRSVIRSINWVTWWSSGVENMALFFAKTTSKVHASSMNWQILCKAYIRSPHHMTKARCILYMGGKVYMNWFQCWIMTSIVYVESESGCYPMAQTSTESHESFCFQGDDDVVHDQLLPKYITPPSSSGPFNEREGCCSSAVVRVSDDHHVNLWICPVAAGNKHLIDPGKALVERGG